MCQFRGGIAGFFHGFVPEAFFVGIEGRDDEVSSGFDFLGRAVGFDHFEVIAAIDPAMEEEKEGRGWAFVVGVYSRLA